MPIKKTKSKIITELYLRKKFSMVQIASELKMSPSSIRYWLDKNNVKRRTINEAINTWYLTKLHKKPFQLKTKFTTKERELKVAGIMLYWGEGGKTKNMVRFTNSDPEMILTFLNFLRKICGVQEERLKALIHMYPDHNEDKLKLFWINTTKIPKERFYKSFIHEGRKGTYKKKSKYGTLAIYYSDQRLLKTILEWINDYKNKLNSPE
ncbi:MAG: hypothetical protein WC545_00665 [Patescibacteria group bacterium]